MELRIPSGRPAAKARTNQNQWLRAVCAPVSRDRVDGTMRREAGRAVNAIQIEEVQIDAEPARELILQEAPFGAETRR